MIKDCFRWQRRCEVWTWRLGAASRAGCSPGHTARYSGMWWSSDLLYWKEGDAPSGDYTVSTVTHCSSWSVHVFVTYLHSDITFKTNDGRFTHFFPIDYLCVHLSLRWTVKFKVRKNLQIYHFTDLKCLSSLQWYACMRICHILFMSCTKIFIF